MSLRPLFAIAFATALFMAVVTLRAASALPQKQNIEKDIPSIAREALKSVVVIETKNELGKSLGQGSGFLVSSDGKVVTNFHVIQAQPPQKFGSPTGLRTKLKDCWPAILNGTLLF
jgi:S1-C subfamily serine protease